MRAEAREKTRKDLGGMQSKVNYLKNAHFISPSSACSASAGDTLVRRVKRSPKELGIKPAKSPERYRRLALLRINSDTAWSSSVRNHPHDILSMCFYLYLYFENDG